MSTMSSKHVESWK